MRRCPLNSGEALPKMEQPHPFQPAMNQPAPRRRSTAALLLLCLSGSLLTACGGGGDSTPATAAVLTTTPSNTTQSTTPQPVVTQQTTPTTSTATDTTCGLPGFQAALITEVNRLRAAGHTCGALGDFAPAADLQWNDKLAQAALGHARDMIAASFFAHTGSNGSTVGTRVTAAGYNWSTVAENIAAGQPTVASVMSAWMASDGHCANVMNPSMRDFAVVCVASTDLSPHWVMDLARAR